MGTTTSSILRLCASLFLLIGVIVLDACSSSNVGTSGSAVTGAAAGEKCVADKDCQAGLECEHGTCMAADDEKGDDLDRAGDDADHHDDDADDGATGQACMAPSDCPAGQECDDGVCK